MFYRRVAALAAAAAIITGACSTAGTAAPSTGGGGGAAGGCKIGFSWNNYTEERWAKWDEPAVKASVTSAISQGIPVIAYDRLIEDPGVLYATFDNVEVGRMEAREIFKAKPKGNYVIIKGNKAEDRKS